MIRINFKYMLLSVITSVFFLFGDLTFAQSSPPLLLNDTDTPGPGGWEINILAALEHATLNDEWQLPLLDINYGMGERIQLTMGLPYVYEHENDSRMHGGFNGVELGFKYRFVDRTQASGSNFSCYPQVYLPLKTGIDSELILPLEWHLERPPFGFTAEAGHVWVTGKSDGWEGGLAAAVLFKDIEFMAEWHTRGLRGMPFDLCEPMINIGVASEWSETVGMYLSVGKNLQGRRHDGETQLWGMLGIQLLF